MCGNGRKVCEEGRLSTEMDELKRGVGKQTQSFANQDENLPDNSITSFQGGRADWDLSKSNGNANSGGFFDLFVCFFVFFFSRQVN